MTSLPVLAGLLKSGVPFGPTMAFLLSSPLLDAPILGLLVFLIGAKLTALYAGVTFFASMGLAALFARLGFQADVKEVEQSGSSGCAPGCGCAPENTPEPERRIPAGGSVDAPVVGLALRAWSRTRQAWSVAWRSFLPIAPRLAIFAAIGAVASAFLPTSWLLRIAGPDQPYGIPLMAAIGVPVHGMATMLLPMTAPLLDKGVATGAVVAFVVTGLAISIPQLGMQTAFFRPRLIAALVLSNIIVAVGLGGLIALVAS